MKKAEILWPELVKTAQSRGQMTYAKVRDLLDYSNCLPIIPALWNITEFCRKRGYPPLTAIVVSQKTGVPSEGFTSVMGRNVESMQAEVYEFDWRGKEFE